MAKPSNGPLHVIAHVEARPDTVEALRQVLLELIEPTRAEPGCRRYELLVEEAHPTRFTFVETWDDAAALETHFASDHFQAAGSRLAELTASEVEILRYRSAE